MPRWQVEFMHFGAQADLVSLVGTQALTNAQHALRLSDVWHDKLVISTSVPTPTPTPTPEPTPVPTPAQNEPIQIQAVCTSVPPAPTTGKLWVVCAYFNPCNYQLRHANYMIFANRLRRQGVPLCTVELAACGTKPNLDGVADNYGMHVPVFCDDVLWAKECLINIGVQRLPETCTIVVWADADLEWAQDDWAARTVAALEQPNIVVVQPFQRATKMKQHETFEHDYAHEPQSDLKACTPLAKAYALRPRPFMLERDIYLFHAGYAWAIRRNILAEMGGLYPYCILGQADFAMAIAFTHNTDRDGGDMGKVWIPDATFSWGELLLDHVRDWQIRVSHIVRGRLGFVSDVHVFHNWHGDEHDRRYMKRGRMIVDFNPQTDVALLPNGVLAWTQSARAKCVNGVPLPARVKSYFENRKEDGRPPEEVAERNRQLEQKKKIMMAMKRRMGF